MSVGVVNKSTAIIVLGITRLRKRFSFSLLFQTITYECTTMKRFFIVTHANTATNNECKSLVL
jgi:hypothetical protein